MRVLPLILATLAQIGFFLPKLPEAAEPATRVPFADKIVHIAIFAFTTWALLRLGPHLRGRKIVIVAGGLFAWAWIIEAIQSLMPNRSADPTDVLADTLGIALGITLSYALARRTRILTSR